MICSQISGFPFRFFFLLKLFDQPLGRFLPQDPCGAAFGTVQGDSSVPEADF